MPINESSVQINIHKVIRLYSSCYDLVALDHNTVNSQAEKYYIMLNCIVFLVSNYQSRKNNKKKTSLKLLENDWHNI